MTTLHILRHVGSECRDMYRKVRDLVMSTGPLRDITNMLNLEITLTDERTLAEIDRDYLWQHCLSLATPSGGCSVDTLDIALKNINFRYGPSGPWDLSGVEKTVKQGSMIVILAH